MEALLNLMWRGLLFFVLNNIGAVVIWFVTGMRRPLDDEMSAMADNDFKYYRNLSVGLILFCIILSVFYFLLN